MDPITLILFIAIGGIMIGAGVHFIPVGGAPAAMATATGWCRYWYCYVSCWCRFNRTYYCCNYDR